MTTTRFIVAPVGCFGIYTRYDAAELSAYHSEAATVEGLVAACAYQKAQETPHHIYDIDVGNHVVLGPVSPYAFYSESCRQIATAPIWVVRLVDGREVVMTGAFADPQASDAGWTDHQYLGIIDVLSHNFGRVRLLQHPAHDGHFQVLNTKPWKGAVR